MTKPKAIRCPNCGHVVDVVKRPKAPAKKQSKIPGANHGHVFAPSKPKPQSKAELNAMLKAAVENTK